MKQIATFFLIVWILLSSGYMYADKETLHDAELSLMEKLLACQLEKDLCEYILYLYESTTDSGHYHENIRMLLPLIDSLRETELNGYERFSVISIVIRRLDIYDTYPDLTALSDDLIPLIQQWPYGFPAFQYFLRKKLDAVILNEKGCISGISEISRALHKQGFPFPVVASSLIYMTPENREGFMPFVNTLIDKKYSCEEIGMIADAIVRDDTPFADLFPFIARCEKLGLTHNHIITIIRKHKTGYGIHARTKREVYRMYLYLLEHPRLKKQPKTDALISFVKDLYDLYARLGDADSLLAAFPYLEKRLGRTAVYRFYRLVAQNGTGSDMRGVQSSFFYNLPQFFDQLTAKGGYDINELAELFPFMFLTSSGSSEIETILRRLIPGLLDYFSPGDLVIMLLYWRTHFQYGTGHDTLSGLNHIIHILKKVGCDPKELIMDFEEFESNNASMIKSFFQSLPAYYEGLKNEFAPDKIKNLILHCGNAYRASREISFMNRVPLFIKELKRYPRIPQHTYFDILNALIENKHLNMEKFFDDFPAILENIHANMFLSIEEKDTIIHNIARYFPEINGDTFLALIQILYYCRISFSELENAFFSRTDFHNLYFDVDRYALLAVHAEFLAMHSLFTPQEIFEYCKDLWKSHWNSQLRMDTQQVLQKYFDLVEKMNMEDRMTYFKILQRVHKRKIQYDNYGNTMSYLMEFFDTLHKLDISDEFFFDIVDLYADNLSIKPDIVSAIKSLGYNDKELYDILVILYGHDIRQVCEISAQSMKPDKEIEGWSFEHSLSWAEESKFTVETGETYAVFLNAYYYEQIRNAFSIPEEKMGAFLKGLGKACQGKSTFFYWAIDAFEGLKAAGFESPEDCISAIAMLTKERTGHFDNPFPEDEAVLFVDKSGLNTWEALPFFRREYYDWKAISNVLALLNNNHDDLIRLEDVFCMKTDPKDDYKNVWKFLLDVKYCKAMSKDRALRFLIDFYGSIDHRFRYDEPPYVYPDWLMLQETMGLTQDNIQKIIIDMNKEDTISSSTVVQRLSDFSWVIGFPFAETWNNKKINLIKQAKDDITETMFEYRALGLSDKEILEFIGVLPEPPSSSSYYDRTPSVTTLKAFLMLSGYFSGSEIVELYRSFDPDALNTMYTRSDRKPSLLIRILLLYFSNHSKKTILEVLKEMTIIIEKTEGRLDIIPYSRTFSQNLEAYREKWPELAENLKVLTKLLEKATKEEE